MIASRTLRLGTRGSALAMWQARHVAELIGRHPERRPSSLCRSALRAICGRMCRCGPSVARPSSRRRSTGRCSLRRWTSRFTASKTSRRCWTKGLTLAAALTREDPRDALVSRDGRLLSDLPAGAKRGYQQPATPGISCAHTSRRAAGRAAGQCADARRATPKRRLRRDHSGGRGPSATGTRRKRLRASVDGHVSRRRCHRESSECARGREMPRR